MRRTTRLPPRWVMRPSGERSRSWPPVSSSVSSRGCGARATYTGRPRSHPPCRVPMGRAHRRRSCSTATRGQVDRFAASYPVVWLQPRLADPAAAAIGAARQALLAGAPAVLVASSADPAGVAAVQRDLGPGAGARIEHWLGQVAAALVERWRPTARGRRRQDDGRRDRRPRLPDVEVVGKLAGCPGPPGGPRRRTAPRGGEVGRLRRARPVRRGA